MPGSLQIVLKSAQEVDAWHCNGSCVVSSCSSPKQGTVAIGQLAAKHGEGFVEAWTGGSDESLCFFIGDGEA